MKHYSPELKHHGRFRCFWTTVMTAKMAIHATTTGQAANYGVDWYARSNCE